MAQYPKDRFDQLPEDLQRVGAHRTPAKRGRGWIGFAWAVLATVVIIFGGLFGLSRYLDDDLGIPIFAIPETPTPTPTPTPTAEPADPNNPDFQARQITVSVLNGTASADINATVAADLTSKGWKVGNVVPASSKDIEETFIYYDDPANEDAARGVAIAIGTGTIRLIPADTYPSPITVVLGLDFPGAVAPVEPAPEETTTE